MYVSQFLFLLYSDSYEEYWSAADHIDEPDELRSELEKTIGRVVQSKSRVVSKPEEVRQFFYDSIFVKCRDCIILK